MAIVGNGPLTNAQRDAINHASVVVRYRSTASLQTIHMMGIIESVNSNQHKEVRRSEGCVLHHVTICTVLLLVNPDTASE